MTPGRSFRQYRIPVELIVPEHKGKVAGIYLIESSPERIGRCAAKTPATLLQGVVRAARINKLLAELLVRLWMVPKRTRSLGRSARPREGLRVEFEYEPPLHLCVWIQQRAWATRCLCNKCAAARKAN